MTHQPTRAGDYGRLIEPATLEIQRLLPGPIERVWSYLTESDLRQKWLASGVMQPQADSVFELVWRNDSLSDAPAVRPAGFPEEHRMAGTVLAIDPPRRLEISWGEQVGSVVFELEPVGDKVHLRLTHRRLGERASLLNVAAGWHTHLDILATRLAGGDPAPFWPNWQARKQDYDQRLAG